jgi:2,3-bisphosphoglycerate-dependent phosphoglycerate mutase
VTTFLIVRHGETDWNVAGRLQGWCDSPLTATGRAQAAAVAARLAAEPIDALVASDLGRTQETAAPIAAGLGLPVGPDPRLRERRYGILEGMTWSQIEHRHGEAYRRLIARDQDYGVPEGESGIEFRDRVFDAFERLAAVHGEARVAVVTHGGVLGIVYRRAHDIALEMPRTFAVPNAALSRARIEGRRWTIDVWADVGHLPQGALDDA